MLVSSAPRNGLGIQYGTLPFWSVLSASAFGEKADGTPAPNIEKMEAKVGRLTLENDFLESALIKAGLLSAKR